MDNYNGKYCPNCGTHLPPEAVFCGACGYKFTDAQSEQDHYSTQQAYYNNQSEYNNQQPNYNQQPDYNNYPPRETPYLPPYPNDSGKTVKIVIIIISIILALAIIAFGIYFLITKTHNNGNDENRLLASTTQTPSPSPTATAQPSPSPSTLPSPTPDANSQFVLPYSSIREVTISDLIGLDAGQLMIARNEIYARHGRQFKTDWLQTHFNSCSWYSVNPYYNYSNEDSMLTALELKNAKFILDYENAHKN